MSFGIIYKYKFTKVTSNFVLMFDKKAHLKSYGKIFFEHRSNFGLEFVKNTYSCLHKRYR